MVLLIVNCTFCILIYINFFEFTDNMKAYREAEKEEMLETEMNHNFEADMYLEKMEHDNEKVNKTWKKMQTIFSF